MYTYFQQNEDETEGLYPSGTVIAMYEGEFEDGKYKVLGEPDRASVTRTRRWHLRVPT